MAEHRVRAAASAEVQENRLFATEVSGIRVLMTRVNGTVFAVINRCPHLGMKMTRGSIENGVVQCPWHGSRYDVRTGENVDWVNAFAGIPMPGWTHKLIAMGKAPSPLTRLETVEEDGSIFVNHGA